MRVFSKRQTAGVIVAMFASVAIPALTPATATAASSCNGVQVHGATELRREIASHPAGTKFCLHAGTYWVRSAITVKSHDRLIGVARRRDGVVVKTRTAEIIFDLHNTTRVRFRHFAITGAINACPHSNCHPTGRAISEGRHVLVKGMHLYRNHSKAIGGAQSGLRIIGSEIDHNGAIAGDALSGGIKVTHPATIKASYFHDNLNNAIWCDVHCGRFTVIDNRVVRNAGNGIFIERSQGPAKIAKNVVKHNNTARLGVHGGITLTDSKDANIHRNTLGHNHGYGISARQDQRNVGWATSGVRIHDNVLHGDPVRGCQARGEVCYHNH